MNRKLRVSRRYIAEFNRCTGDNIERVIRKLQRRGYDIERLPHLTSIRIRRPQDVSFAAFRDELRGHLQPRRGGLLLHSNSGKSWVCSMKGNRPGTFIRVM